MHAITQLTAALFVVLSFGIPAAAQPAGATHEAPAVFTAIVARLGGAPTADVSRMEIAIRRLVTADSRTGWPDHPEGSARPFVDAIRHADGGTISIDGVATRILAAVASPSGPGTRIVIVLPTSALGYGGVVPPDVFGVVLLEIDGRGRGTGELIAGATLFIDERGRVDVDERLAPLQLLADVKAVREP
jgi:hypothetical protein